MLYTLLTMANTLKHRSCLSNLIAYIINLLLTIIPNDRFSYITRSSKCLTPPDFSFHKPHLFIRPLLMSSFLYTPRQAADNAQTETYTPYVQHPSIWTNINLLCLVTLESFRLSRDCLNTIVALMAIPKFVR